jgi:hypothetical protein
MPLTLDDRECELLTLALANYLQQLRFERVRTDDREAQLTLTRFENAIEALYDRLASREAAGAS